MSLYSYEAQAIKKIKDDVKKYQLGEVVANFNLYNEHAQRYFEIDLLVFTNWLIYLVELKHWNGRIVIQPYEWLITNASGHKEVRKDPHILNSNKARMFAGKLRNQFPHFPRLFVSSTLLLTHPKADVIGTTNFDNKIEFDTITIHKVENFISHLRKKKKFNQKIYHSRLSKEQLNTVYSYFENINLSKNSKHLSILPNIKILKEIGVFDDYVEYLAKDTLASKHLFRLRVFYSSIFVEKPELMQKALATKKAFGKVKDHTNLLQVDLFLTDNEDIVEKSLWSDRGTLRNVINNHAPLSEEESLTIIEGILNGLKVIHELPICHRNIAPENILMVGKTPKLMNFDLCYQPIDDRVTVIPNPEQLLVSAYMPPELYQGETDQKGDLFSVGAILYELLTGKKLFESTRSYKARGTIDQEAVDYINDLEPKVSKNTIDTVFKLVQLEPSLRPNSAEEVLKTLCRKSYNIKKMFNKKLEMGTNIGMCYNIDFIAEGSEAQLYEGLGPNGVRWVLKVFNHEVELDRIMRERDIVSSINRQHILKYVSFGEIIDDKRKYIIFEKVRGKNLRQHIQENETPDLENFKKVAFDLLRAIDYIHEEIEEENKPIYVHNDIKPENIILDENLNATLIDFGLATEGECICMHSGTEGYIAPDMVSGIDRNCNISGDIFSLGVTLFEWFFGKSPYETVSLKEKPIDFKNLRTNISDVFFDWWIKAINFRAENRFSNAKEMRFELQKALDQKKSFDEAKKNPKEDVEISLKKGPEEKSKNITTANSCKTCNQFVSYLNSMIVFNPDAENSLAESQACSEQFKNIYVEHPLISKVYNLFQNKKEIFILTGHAGDGKSTVCIEFYKKLKKIKPGHPISIPIKRREEFNVNGKKLVMIKDFSEWSGNKKQNLIDEMLEGENSFFIVSNTGTLLESFKNYARRVSRSQLIVEEELLNAIAKNDIQDIKLCDQKFKLINLAMENNTSIAKQIFKKMIDKKNWEKCQNCEFNSTCIPFRNFEIVSSNKEIVSERLFLAYEKLYEYGERLTLRQFVGHLAFLITGGVNDSATGSNQKLNLDLLFYNNFFGNDARHENIRFSQLKAVILIRKQNFGMSLLPELERKIWLYKDENIFKFNSFKFVDIYESLKKLANVSMGDLKEQSLVRKQYRIQIRRAIYFLHNFLESSEIQNRCIANFLDSPKLLDFIKWRNENISNRAKVNLKKALLHVLKEHFLGLRLPLDVNTQNSIYITLCRKSNEIRQTAQLLIAEFTEDQFIIETIEHRLKDRLLVLKLQKTDIFLKLDLAFLDYVYKKYAGETWQKLSDFYVDRLETFKAGLLNHYMKNDANNDYIKLLEYTNEQTFRKVKILVNEDRLEILE